MNTHRPVLSIVIPAYNEELRIGATLADIKRFFSDRALSYEIIVVSDGATDGTEAVVRDFAEGLPALRLISYCKNRGKGFAVKAGMLAAKGEYRLFMDADNSVRIDSIEPFLREMGRNGCEVAIGSIDSDESGVIDRAGWHRRLASKASRFLIRALATPGIRDTQRGFKLFTERAVKAVFPLQRTERFGFDVELLVIAREKGFGIREIPVYWENPSGSKVSLRSYYESLIELWRIYVNMLRGAYRA
ncbi:MAG TPA: dolichyl-phosphate beta-glucosyltransferase [Candidatus Paceibacterota bacterium]|nr:dolichyl-phosphate beta-glucosyltransferase [Candidatus Paceibacterota bacterium]